MLQDSKSYILAKSANKSSSNKLNKYKQEIILMFGIVLFIVGTIFQAKLQNFMNGWQGVIAQLQVMISIILVASVPRKGYIVALVLNISLSVIVTLQVIVNSNRMAIPGMLIPIVTLIIISVIELYSSQIKAKANQIIEERSKSTKQILELQEVSIMAMSALAETRDHETGRHIQRTKLYVKVLANYLYNHGRYQDELNDSNIELIIASAPLHDIGKVGIPDSILLKPGKLTDEEFELIKTHTQLGYEAILKAEKLMGKTDTFFKFAQEIVLYHHERWDGEGYLKGLKGENIPLSARIMAVADMYDALTSKRVYKDIHSHEDAHSTIVGESGKRFDPEIIKAFISCHKEFEKIADEYRE